MNHINRGIRNNNPLNLKRGLPLFVGEVKAPTDKIFRQFTTIFYGYRAAIICLLRYYKDYKLRNVKSIITRWAPASENDTITYIRTVVTFMRNNSSIKYTSVYPLEVTDIPLLVAAMAFVESRVIDDMFVINQAFIKANSDYNSITKV